MQALFIVFTVHPWHRNVGRAILQTPKGIFFDSGLVRGDHGVHLENVVATMLLKQLIECKLGDNKPHRALTRFAEQFLDAEAVQIVYNLRQEEFRNGIAITDAANWLAQLAA